MEHPLIYDHYKVLGVPRNASSSAIKKAYRERVKNWHPDRNASPKAAAVFQAVHEAYIVLIDTNKRSSYDEQLRFYKRAAPGENQGNAKRPEPPTYRRRPLREEAPDRPVHLFAYYGLHLTGLLFGTVLICGILIGCTWFDWPAYILVLCAPGIAVIPDSLAGLRAK